MNLLDSILPAGYVWKAVPGYGGMYYVSDDGHVFSLGARTSCGNRCPRFMKLATDRYGYRTVSLTASGGKQHKVTVHRLVAIAFLGQQDSRWKVVNHKNGIRSDNRLENLEWVTQSENSKHAFAIGNHRASGGEGYHSSKLTELQVRVIRRCRGEVSQKELADLFGINVQAVSKIQLGLRWSHVKHPVYEVRGDGSVVQKVDTSDDPMTQTYSPSYEYSVPTIVSDLQIRVFALEKKVTDLSEKIDRILASLVPTPSTLQQSPTTVTTPSLSA